MRAPPHGEDPVELGKAHVVADGQAQLDAVGGGAEHDLLARGLVIGLAVHGAVDLDVEHVELAIGRLDLAVGADVQRGVAQLRLAVDALGDRAGHEVDAQLARRVARPRDRPAVERLGAVAQIGAAAEQAPFLGQHDEARAIGRSAAHEAIGRLEVAGLVRSRRELHGGGTKY
jgi:hypothetical protein